LLYKALWVSLRYIIFISPLMYLAHTRSRHAQFGTECTHFGYNRINAMM